MLKHLSFIQEFWVAAAREDPVPGIFTNHAHPIEILIKVLFQMLKWLTLNLNKILIHETL